MKEKLFASGWILYSGILIMIIGSLLPIIHLGGQSFLPFNWFIIINLLVSISYIILKRININKKMIYIPLFINFINIVILFTKNIDNFKINAYLPGFVKIGMGAYFIIIGFVLTIIGVGEITNKKTG